MCFIKKVEAPVVTEQIQEPVKRSKADASLTKNSMNNTQTGVKPNIKTSPLGLDETADTGRKTLLGE